MERLTVSLLVVCYCSVPSPCWRALFVLLNSWVVRRSLQGMHAFAAPIPVVTHIASSLLFFAFSELFSSRPVYAGRDQADTVWAAVSLRP